MRRGGQAEFGAVPPGDGEGTVGGHGLVGEVDADVVGGAGNGAKVHAEVGVGVDVVVDERGDDGGGDAGGVPGARLVAGRGEDVALVRDFGGGLEEPSFGEIDAVGLRDGGEGDCQQDKGEFEACM